MTKLSALLQHPLTPQPGHILATLPITGPLFELPLVIDLRSSVAFVRGHVATAVNLPLEEGESDAALAARLVTRLDETIDEAGPPELLGTVMFVTAEGEAGRAERGAAALRLLWSSAM